MKQLTDAELDQIFREWWKESYPSIPVGEYSLQSHLGFGRHIANILRECPKGRCDRLRQLILNWSDGGKEAMMTDKQLRSLAGVILLSHGISFDKPLLTGLSFCFFVWSIAVTPQD